MYMFLRVKNHFTSFCIYVSFWLKFSLRRSRGGAIIISPIGYNSKCGSSRLAQVSSDSVLPNPPSEKIFRLSDRSEHWRHDVMFICLHTPSGNHNIQLKFCGSHGRLCHQPASLFSPYKCVSATLVTFTGEIYSLFNIKSPVKY